MLQWIHCDQDSKKTCCIDATACELRKQYAAIFTVFLTYDAFHQGEQDSFY